MSTIILVILAGGALGILWSMISNKIDNNFTKKGEADTIKMIVIIGIAIMLAVVIFGGR